MSYPLRKKYLLSLLGATLLVVGSTQATADVQMADNEWEYRASVYFFAPSIKGSTAAGSDIDVGFDTLLDNLNMTFMGAFEVRKSKWSALADVLYLNVGANDGARVPVTGPLGRTRGLKADASLKVRGWILSFLGGYNLRDDEKLFLDLIAGVRYLEMKNEFELGLQSRRFGNATEIAAGAVIWDGVAGVRGRAKLDGNWYLPFHLDIGTGDSDLTWQAAGGVGYGFDWGDVSLTYRYMEWDFGSSSEIEDISFSGPQLTAAFRF